jgi:hypothetical protein
MGGNGGALAAPDRPWHNPRPFPPIPHPGDTACYDVVSNTRRG